MRNWVYVTVECPSVRPSVLLSRRSTAATAAGGFAAERPAGGRCRSIAAGALQASCCTCAGAQQQTRVALCWEPTEEAQHRLVSNFKAIVVITCALCLWRSFVCFWFSDSPGTQPCWLCCIVSVIQLSSLLLFLNRQINRSIKAAVMFTWTASFEGHEADCNENSHVGRQYFRQRRNRKSLNSEQGRYHSGQTKRLGNARTCWERLLLYTCIHLKNWIRYDTIRDAILTCALKLNIKST